MRPLASRFACMSATYPPTPGNFRQSKLVVCHHAAQCRCRHGGELLSSDEAPAEMFATFAVLSFASMIIR